MSAGCWGGLGGSEEHCDGGTTGAIGYAGLASATITLEDNTSPKVTVVGGTLTTGTELEGEQNLAITGTDTGSGIYQAILEVDGKATQSTTVDNNGGHCENVGQTTDGRPAFLYPVPCALEVNDQYVFFNMAGIPDGPHRLTVLVTDAAGNATTVLNREAIVGRGACNGTCGDQAKACGERCEAPEADQAPLRALRDHAVGQPSVNRRAPLWRAPGWNCCNRRPTPEHLCGPSPPPTTDAAGEWTFVVPRGPSRVLLVAWRSHALDAGYAAQLEYHESVFADIGLKAPRRVRVGCALRLPRRAGRRLHSTGTQHYSDGNLLPRSMADDRNAPHRPPRPVCLRLHFQHGRGVLLPVPRIHPVHPCLPIPCKRQSASESKGPAVTQDGGKGTSAPCRLPASRVGLPLTIIALLLASPAIQPPTANAGTYDVFSCTQPDSAAAPVDGWTSFSNNPDMLAEDDCAQGRDLTAGMLGWVEVPVGAEAGWTFLPPAGALRSSRRRFIGITITPIMWIPTAPAHLSR